MALSSQLIDSLLPEVKKTDRTLGRGAYGKVKEMILSDGTIVAGKKFHDVFNESGNDEKGIKSIKELFEQECLRMSQLHHPNIVQFLGVHYKSGSDIPILIMERLPMSLTNYLEQNKIIPNHIKNSILLDVSLGLLYLHTQTPPIIHRDLTANNVLLTSDMKAKITDFGMSRIIEPDPVKFYMKMTTCPGNVLYMPPEALQPNYKETLTSEDKYTVTSDNFDKLDVFSFGVLILHVYTQQWPNPINNAESEAQRRQHLLDKVECHYMKQLAEKCLYNLPEYRPHTLDLVRSIEGIRRNDDKEGIIPRILVNIETIRNFSSEVLAKERDLLHLTDLGQSTRGNTKDRIETFFQKEYDDIVESQVTANNGDDFKTDEILIKHMKVCYESVKREILNEVCGQIYELFVFEPNKTLLLEKKEKLLDISHACDLLLHSFRINASIKGHVEVCAERATVDEVCGQIYELFVYDPSKTLLLEEKGRLRDISRAYGLLLFHYKRGDQSFKNRKVLEQDLNSELIKKIYPLFLDMVSVSPPFVLYVPEQFEHTKAREFVDCNNIRKKMPHSFHVRIPIILNSYLGSTCVKSLVCKGSE